MFYGLLDEGLGHSSHELGSMFDWHAIEAHVLPIIDDLFGEEVGACMLSHVPEHAKTQHEEHRPGLSARHYTVPVSIKHDGVQPSFAEVLRFCGWTTRVRPC